MVEPRSRTIKNAGKEKLISSTSMYGTRNTHTGGVGRVMDDPPPFQSENMQTDERYCLTASRILFKRIENIYFHIFSMQIKVCHFIRR
jgi:hypothetical protein